MAAVAPAFDPLTGHMSIDLGPDPAPVAVAGDAFSACFQVEPDGSLRLLALEPAGRVEPARLRH